MSLLDTSPKARYLNGVAESFVQGRYAEVILMIEQNSTPKGVGYSHEPKERGGQLAEGCLRRDCKPRKAEGRKPRRAWK